MATKKAAKRKTKSAGTRRAPVPSAAMRGMPAAAQGTEDDLAQLVAAARRTLDKLRELEGDVPEDKEQEYLRNRHFAREAFERAEITAFQNLVEQQKAQLPAVTASMARLAQDVEAAAGAVGVLNLVSASLGVLASVVTLFA